MQGSPITVVRSWRGIVPFLRAAAIGITTLSTVCAYAQVKVIETSPPAAAPAVSAPMAVPAPGQGGVVLDPSGKPVEVKPGESKPGGDGKKPDGDKKPDSSKSDEAGKDKKADEAQPVVRPTEPKKPANPDELKVRPVDGKVTFSFKGQPWPAVLEWLADISQMSLEWLEAPPGYLDLTTQREYTVREARDLINSILMGRGYTLLRNGEVLMVAKLKDLDISRVPRVLPTELDDRDDNEMVRVLFDLDRLQAEQLVEDLKPLLGTFGKITAMKTTNRIDVLETAGNLRRLRDTIKDEQSASGQDTMLKEFQLRHARAEVVIGTLEKLLGIESKRGGGGGGGMSPEQMQQMQQQMMEQQQQMQQQHGGKQGGNKKPPESKVMLAVYQRKNAIYAQATPDKLAIIEQAIKLLDVPATGASSLDQQIARVRPYRLVAADPQVVVNLLKELGNLDPSTQLQIDMANRIILVDAPLADHYTIQELIKKIDGSARQLHVIQLRRLNAEYVAGSIEFLMRGPKQDDRRQRYMWDWGGGYGRQNNEQKDNGFQVEADIEANRLLLRANDLERQEIDALLVKLGEDPYRDPRGETMRVLRSEPGPATDELLERLKRLSPVPIKIDVPPAATSTPPRGVPTESAADEEQPRALSKPTGDRSASVIVHPTNLTQRTLATIAQVAQDELTQDQQAEGRPQLDAAPPEISGRQEAVTVTRGPKGLIFTSPDPTALADVMRLADELSTRDARYHLFPLKHTYAKDMAKLFANIFASEGAEESDKGARNIYYFDDPPPKEPKEMGRLSKRPPLKFIPDPVTNSLLVQGADDRQLAEIRSLIEYYDHLEEPNSESVRQTEFITFKYAKARDVSEVIKEVFRDLLSPNDKALTQYNQQKAQQEQQNRPLFSYLDSDLLSDKGTDENLPKFKGLISMGVDQRSNSLFISAPGRLLKSIKAMAQRLDDAAQPQEPVTRVVRMSGAISDPLVKEALLNFADPAAARRNRERQHNGANQNNAGQQNQNNNRNGRNGQNHRNGQHNGSHPGGL